MSQAKRTTTEMMTTTRSHVGATVPVSDLKRARVGASLEAALKVSLIACVITGDK